MNIFGITASDPFAQRFLTGYVNPDAVKEYQDMPAGISVKFDEAHMMQKGSEENFRPYLLLAGKVRSVKFDDDSQTPYGIESVTFGASGPDIIYRYNFNEEELKKLVDLGFFTSRPPEVPAIFTGAPFEDLPIQVKRLAVIEPDPTKDYDSENPPLVIIDLGDLTDCVTNQVDSGYNLVDYFQPSPYAKAMYPFDYVRDEEVKDFENDAAQTEETAEPELYSDLDAEEETLFAGEEEIPELPELEVEIPETEEEIEDRIYAESLKLREVKTEAATDDAEQTGSDIEAEIEAALVEAETEDVLSKRRHRKKVARDKLAESKDTPQFDAIPDIGDPSDGDDYNI